MRWLFILIWLASPAWAQTIAVSSGEHDGYARLVVPLPDGADWQVGRTDTGYELALTGPDLRFDLTRVFDLIPKTRLTGVFADPSTGRLQLTLSCVCHALPFQLDARTLVIDVRDGLAPPGSSFEVALDGRSMAALSASPQLRPRARPVVTVAGGYDWLAQRAGVSAVAPGPQPMAGPTRTSNPNLNPLRDTLITQLSRGAADGVIQLALPQGGSNAEMADDVQTRVTKVPGLAVLETRAPVAELQPDGAACLPDARLDLAAWGGDGDVAMQIATTRAALVGEFDKPDQAAVAQSVRMQLHLGFGAEAELTMTAFGATDGDVPVWTSLARIMDDKKQGTNAFAQMAGCDTAAALWAVLAAPEGNLVTGANVPAVQRAFSALPPHLRLHLAPRLAERATAMGEAELARAVTTAANRPTEMPQGAQAVLQARMDMAEGRVADAAAAMEALLTKGGPTAAEALVLLVQARVALAEPMAAEVPGVAAAMLQEYVGTEQEADLRRAWHLAMAAAGDFGGVFAASPDAETLPDVWRMLAHIGTDDAILRHGILPEGAVVVAEHDAATLLAERLLALGFADAAGQWMGPLTSDATEVDQQLRARIDLARGDGRAVLSTLAGQSSPAALILKAQAEQALGQPDLARVTWDTAGDQAASLRAAGWAQQWDDVAAGPEGAWQIAAKSVSDLPAVVAEPLARGQALVDDSAAVRAQVDALLAAVPQP